VGAEIGKITGKQGRSPEKRNLAGGSRETATAYRRKVEEQPDAEDDRL